MAVPFPRAENGFSGAKFPVIIPVVCVIEVKLVPPVLNVQLYPSLELPLPCASLICCPVGVVK